VHCGIDAIGIASEIVLALNHLVAQTIDPLESAVISVTQFHAGDTTDVLLPEYATLIGTTQALTEEVQNILRERSAMCARASRMHAAQAHASCTSDGARQPSIIFERRILLPMLRLELLATRTSRVTLRP